MADSEIAAAGAFGPTQARRSVLSGGAWSVSSWILSIGLGFPLTIALVRLLPSREYGALAVATATIALLMPLAGFGLAGSVSRLASEAVTLSGEPGLGSVMRRAARVAGLLTAIVGLIAIGVVTLMAVSRSLRPGLLPFVVLLPVLLSTPFQQAAQGLVQAAFRPSVAFRAGLVVSLLVGLLTTAVLVSGQRLAVEIAGVRTIAAIVGLWLLVVGSGWGEFTRRGRALPTPQTSAFVAYGSVLTLSLGLDAAISQLDVVVLGASRGAAEVGAYAPVSRLADTVITIWALLGGYLLPALTAAAARGHETEIGALYRWGSRWALTICAPALGLMLVVPGSLLHVLFGDRTAGLTTPARILSLGVLASVLLGFNGLVLVAMGAVRTAIQTAVIGLIASTAACILLVPRFGANGAASATVIALVGANLIVSVILLVRQHLAPWDRPLMFTLAAFAAACIVSGLISRLLLNDRVIQVVIVAAVTGLATLAASLAAGDQSDRKLVSDFVRRRSQQAPTSAIHGALDALKSEEVGPRNEETKAPDDNRTYEP
jgi:O-antigen/teichoic acid export membrane protein